ncbi:MULTISPECIES: glycosyltransferase family A protein [unclassified Cobetia]|uniref:glycosyltransferase family A protein n=1 Tax=unclassified Cobetia TaxID=2609414 RepID=UPI0020974DFF|nr:MULTISPECIES: glycosyltransferase family A protein [unclassified Cobetia]MCO7230980.1 glycosyltransferase family 2 protein [Cobetia sp. Dlab-2-AX]MCO7234613.1 glycosyltransferase family 2 protein [Cobetia sp. Dlab-2-U]
MQNIVEQDVAASATPSTESTAASRHADASAQPTLDSRPRVLVGARQVDDSARRQVPELTFLISTLDDGLYSVPRHDALPGARFLIVHQLSDPASREQYREYALANFDSRFEYLAIDGRGLSKSRNTALAACATRYAYVLDDDIELHPQAVALVMEAFTCTEAAAISFPHVKAFPLHERDPDRPAPPVSFKTHSLLSLARVRSVDMALDLCQFHARFDEQFGLGTDQPSGEEFIVLSDARRQGARLMRANLGIVAHAGVTSGSDFYSTPAKARTKGRMFARATGSRFSPLSLAFFLRKAPVAMKHGHLATFAKHYFR